MKMLLPYTKGFGRCINLIYGEICSYFLLVNKEAWNLNFVVIIFRYYDSIISGRYCILTYFGTRYLDENWRVLNCVSTYFQSVIKCSKIWMEWIIHGIVTWSAWFSTRFPMYSVSEQLLCNIHCLEIYFFVNKTLLYTYVEGGLHV
jgi:hypothetical protein